MKIVTVIVLLIGIGLIYLFLSPYFSPGKYELKHGNEQIERSQIIKGEGLVAPPAGEEEKNVEKVKTAPSEDDSPFCDFKYFKEKGRKITIPKNAQLVRKEEKSANLRGWTWLNVWAAWCKPCKKEIPLISNFIKNFNSTNGGLSLIYLSVDDDERELRKFISETQIHSGMIYWLKDDETRSYWYSSVGLEYPVTLPVQVFLDSKSKLRCVRIGTVSEKDLARIVKMIQEG